MNGHKQNGKPIQRVENPRISSFLEILEIIKDNGGRQLTSKEIEDKTTVGHTRTVEWLRYLRFCVDHKRSFANGYIYSKRINEKNHQPQWIYWWDGKQ
jgi:hypothetical protein